LRKWHTRFRNIVPSLTVFYWLWTTNLWRKLSSQDINFLNCFKSDFLAFYNKNCSWDWPFKCIFVEVKHLAQRQ
jgi:hypothetical protein